MFAKCKLYNDFFPNYPLNKNNRPRKEETTVQYSNAVVFTNKRSQAKVTTVYFGLGSE